MTTGDAIGKVEWIGLRTAKREAIRAVATAEVSEKTGLVGDYFASSGGDRQVTFFQEEDLADIAAALELESVARDNTRRNIVVSGLRLRDLFGQRFAVGECEFECTGDCRPCGRMEETIGPGARAAMTDKGGITAKVIRAGKIHVGDEVVRL